MSAGLAAASGVQAPSGDMNFRPVHSLRFAERDGTWRRRKTAIAACGRAAGRPACPDSLTRPGPASAFMITKGLQSPQTVNPSRS